ncbi:MAG: hypothetical protein AAFP77_24780 [Bacteroidota bacterium]
MPYRLLCMLALTLAGTFLYAQRISGIFRTTDAQMEYLEQLDWETFVQEDERLNSEGYRLTNIETTGQGAERTYWGIYTESSLRDTLIKTNSWVNFVKAKRAMASAGFLLSNVQAYAISETDAHFVGVWYKNDTDTPHKIWKLDSPESLNAKTEDMAKQQFYLQEVEVFLTPSGTANYLAIYHYSPIPVRNYVQIYTEEEVFDKDRQQRQRSKIRLVDYERYNAKEADYQLGVYQPGTYDNRILFNYLRADFNGKWEQLEKEGLKLVGWEVRG